MALVAASPSKKQRVGDTSSKSCAASSKSCAVSSNSSMASCNDGMPSVRRRCYARFGPVIAVLAMLAVGGVFLAGCTVQYGLDTKVEADGSGTVGIRLAADKELQDALSNAADSVGGLGGLGGLSNLGDLGSLGDLGDLGALGDLADLGILGSILGGLGDSGILENLGTLGRILQALDAVGDLTEGLPSTADDLFNLILGQIPGDWQVERGTDSSGTSWVNLSRSFSDLEELEQIMSGSVISSVVPMDEFYIHQDKGFFGTKTVFSTSLDPEEAISGAQQESPSLPADLLETVLAIQNRLTLPGDIQDNNADQIEGNILVWNIGLSGETEMHAESVVRNWAAIVGVVVAGVVVLALIILAVALILRRRRRRNPPSQPTRANAVSIAAPGNPNGENAGLRSNAGKVTGPAASAEVTGVRPQGPVVSPSSEAATPPATIATTPALNGAGAAAAGAVTFPAETSTDTTPSEPVTEAPAPTVPAQIAAKEETAPAPAAKPRSSIPLRPSRLPADGPSGETSQGRNDSSRDEVGGESRATQPLEDGPGDQT